MSAYIDSIIGNALATAQSQTSLADAAAASAITAAEGFATPSFTPVTFALTATEPAVPDVENSTYTFEAQRDQLIALLTSNLADFFVKYYPLASDAFDAATNWLVNSITNGGTGLNPAVEAQIWQRDRDRVTAEGLRVEAQALSEFSGRGFILPPGAAAARLLAVKTGQLESMQAASRDAAIKQAEIEIENMRFSIEQAIKSRMQALGAAAEYIRGIMSAPDAAARVASINSDAKARMMAATSDLYRARLARDELAMKMPMMNAELGVRVGDTATNGFYHGIDSRVRAAAAAADVYARAAQAALASLSSVASASSASFG